MLFAMKPEKHSSASQTGAPYGPDLDGCKAGILRSVSALDVSPTRKEESAATTETIRLAQIAASTRNATAEVRTSAKNQRYALGHIEDNLLLSLVTAVPLLTLN